MSVAVAVTGILGHRTYPRAEDFWKSFSTMLWHQDEPVASTNVFAQWTVMAEAHRHGIPVLLDGQGADEILCGYQKYYYFYLWHLLRHLHPKLLREGVLWFYNRTHSFWGLDDASKYLPAALRRPLSVLNRLGTPEFRNQFADSQAEFGPDGSILERQKRDLNYASLPALLHYEDRNSMAHSVEARLPFLDYSLVEFAINCPPSFKLRDGWSKWILRKALAGTLPEAIRLRKTKLGFDTPQREWMRQGLMNGHVSLWNTPRLHTERFLSSEKLVREVTKFLHGDVGALSAGALFRAICLEMWARVYSVT